MTILVDENGNLTMMQGDSGSVIVEGIDNSANYTVYLAIYDKNRNLIGSELSVQSHYLDNVEFVLTGSFTDLLKVPKNKTAEIYFYGLKMCNPDTGYEDTLILGKSDIGELNTIIVYPKKVEGI